jgi:hypothetical protein
MRPMGFETRDPVPQRQRVVRPQPLDVEDLEFFVLHDPLHVADGIQLSIRKHVAVDELGGEIGLPALGVVRDPMIQK